MHNNFSFGDDLCSGVKREAWDVFSVQFEAGFVPLTQRDDGEKRLKIEGRKVYTVRF